MGGSALQGWAAVSQHASLRKKVCSAPAVWCRPPSPEGSRSQLVADGMLAPGRLGGQK